MAPAHRQRPAGPTDAAAFACCSSPPPFLGVGSGSPCRAQHIAAAFHPDTVDRSVLVLNALLGLGTALAPVFVALFVGLGFWWGLPVLSVDCSSACSRQPAPAAGARAARSARAAAASAAAPIPARFWLFAAFAVLYGICETMNGNWAQLDMTSRAGRVDRDGVAWP